MKIPKIFSKAIKIKPDIVAWKLLDDIKIEVTWKRL